MNCKLHNSAHAGNCRIAEIAICVRTCEKSAAVGHDPGMRYTIAALVIVSDGRGHHVRRRRSDAGFTVETSTAGVVISKWEPGRGFTGDRYRLRVTAKSGGRFTVAVMCQSKAGGNEWFDCDDLRPQWALDVQAKVTAQIEAAAE